MVHARRTGGDGGHRMSDESKDRTGSPWRPKTSYSATYGNYSAMWFSPPEWLEWVTATFGTSDWFDPCSKTWKQGDPDGLSMSHWCQRFYCNHPGSRGSTAPWWAKTCEEMDKGARGIWCAFNCEQLRHMKPSPYHRPGWLVMPAERLGFIWGGPDIVTNEKAVERGEAPKWRRHGSRCQSPGNWTVFWSSAKPAPTPSPSVIVRTGFGEAEVEEARRWARHWKRKAQA